MWEEGNHMDPVLFSIGGLEIRWYSVLILVGVFVAYFLITREANRFKIKYDFIFNLIFWVLIMGIIGARVFFVIFSWDYYSKNLSEIYKIWNGGLAIHGGIIAGFITLILYCKKYNVDILKITDIFAPALIIAQAIGRWGNFFNSEAYGSSVSYQTLVNMKIIPQFVIDNMYINGSYHLPMFYFESIACLIGFIILMIIRRKKYIKKGQIMSTYLIWYGIVRGIIETFRTDSLMIANVKVAQILSVIMISAGVYIFFTQAKKPKLDDLYNSIDDEVKF
jgi:phosphatidylglycerol---prolipoprotein diacylglyceryl transferase